MFLFMECTNEELHQVMVFSREWLLFWISANDLVDRFNDDMHKAILVRAILGSPSIIVLFGPQRSEWAYFSITITEAGLKTARYLKKFAHPLWVKPP